MVTGSSLLRTASLPVATNMTFTAWVRRQVSSLGVLCQLNNAGGAIYNDWVWSVVSLNKYGCQGVSQTYVGCSRAVTPPSGWVFCAGSCRGTGANDIRAYLSALGSDEMLEALAVPATIATPTQLWFGTDDVNSFVNGRIAFVKIWDAVLTREEILREKYSVVPKRSQNLHLWSPLRFSANDFSGKGRNWTVGGSPVLEADEPPILWDDDAYAIQTRTVWRAPSASPIWMPDGMPGFHPGDGPLDFARFYQSPNASYAIPSGAVDGTATVTGISATGAMGTVTATGDANRTQTGIAATSATGTVPATGGATVTQAGIAATSATGTVTATGTASVSASGIAATAATGTDVGHGDANISATGIAATSAVGTVIAGVSISVSVSGIAATGSIGTVIATGAATVTQAGISATSSTGTDVGLGDANTSASGTAATSATGTAIATGSSPDATANVTGIAATATTGTVSANGAANVTVSGVPASGVTGTVTGTGTANAVVTGVQVTAASGATTTTGAANVQAFGVSATSALGQVVAFQSSGDATATVTGIAALSAVGQVQAYGPSAGGYFGPETYIQRRPLPAPDEDMDEVDAETVAILVAAMEIYREDSHAG